MSSPSREPLPASIGRYEILRELGRGAMGVVYEAADPLLGRTVALKTIRLGATVPAAERAHFEQRFFAEARAVARLQHPAIVVVHDVGQDPASGDFFIALEYLRGRTLTEVVQESGALPWRAALRIVMALARALQHAHEHGIVHRDVKPDNVILLDSGEAKLMDFGIAKTEAAQLTVAGQVFGTPRYMSPEQALGEPADARSDLFALGSLAWFLLTGRHAFDGATIPVIITQVAQADPPPPSQYAPAVPPEVDAIVRRLMARQPGDRHADGRALVDDIEPLLATDTRPAPAIVPQPTVDVAPVVSATPTPTRGLAPLVVLAIVALLVGAGTWRLLRRAAPAEMAAPGLSAPDAPAAAGTSPEETALADGYSRIRFELDHALRRGRVAVSVDGTVAFEDDLEGQTTRRLRFIKTSKGRLTTDIDVPAGDHTLRVEVAWDDDRKVRTVKGIFEAGQTRTLDAELGGLIRKNLDLELR